MKWFVSVVSSGHTCEMFVSVVSSGHTSCESKVKFVLFNDATGTH